MVKTNLKADLHFQSQVAVTCTVQTRVSDIVWRLLIVDDCTHDAVCAHIWHTTLACRVLGVEFRVEPISHLTCIRRAAHESANDKRCSCVRGFRSRACDAARTRTTSKGLESSGLLLRWSISWKSIGYARASYRYIQYMLKCASKCSAVSRLHENMQSNAHLNEFDKLLHACKNNSAPNNICHTIHLPTVRAVHLACDITLHAQRRTHTARVRHALAR